MEGDQRNRADSHIPDMLLGHHTGQEAQDQLPVDMDLWVGTADTAGTALVGVPAPVLPRKNKTDFVNASAAALPQVKDSREKREKRAKRGYKIPNPHNWPGSPH